MKKIIITTQNLKIRNLVPSDLDAFFEYRSNPEVTKYQGFDVMDKPMCESFINRHTARDFGIPGAWIQLGIENRLTGKIVGDCALKLEESDSRLAEIGITISHLQQKKGYAKETFQALLEFLFDAVKIHRITETVDAENTASINLLKSMGFRQEGHFIENIFFNGKWGSEFQYAMLKSEWDQLRK